jgi:hypothetical protein
MPRCVALLHLCMVDAGSTDCTSLSRTEQRQCNTGAWVDYICASMLLLEVATWAQAACTAAGMPLGIPMTPSAADV